MMLGFQFGSSGEHALIAVIKKQRDSGPSGEKQQRGQLGNRSAASFVEISCKKCTQATKLSAENLYLLWPMRQNKTIT